MGGFGEEMKVGGFSSGSGWRVDWPETVVWWMRWWWWKGSRAWMEEEGMSRRTDASKMVDGERNEGNAKCLQTLQHGQAGTVLGGVVRRMCSPVPFLTFTFPVCV